MPYANPQPLPSSKIVSIPSGNPNYRTWPLTKITFGHNKRKQQELIMGVAVTQSSVEVETIKKVETIESNEKSVIIEKLGEGNQIKSEIRRSEPQMINKNDKIDDRDSALKQVKDILSTSPQLSTSPRRRTSELARKFSLKVDLSTTQQQFSQELLSPCTLRKKSGEIVKPSLKRGKSEPVTPTFPKYVHFNSDLEQVKLFDGAQRPQAVSADVSSEEGSDDDDYFDLSVSDSDDDDHRHEEEEEAILVINLPNMPRMTTEHCSKFVFVESIFLSGDRRKLQGRIHVQNFAFHKVVEVRYTFDFWQSVSEVKATYVDGGSNRNDNLHGFDIFIFSIDLIDNSRNPIDGKVMYFAVRYQVNDCEYWDNNDKQNYQVNFKRVSSSSSNRSITSSKKDDNNSRTNSYYFNFNRWSPSASKRSSSSSSKSTITTSSSSSRHAKALEAASPPTLSKNVNKKSSRYDLSVSLSAAKSASSTKSSTSLLSTTTTTTTKSLSTIHPSDSNDPNNPPTPGDNPTSQYFPTIAYGQDDYNPLFASDYIGGKSGTSEVPMTAATSSWDDVKSNPIAIPKPASMGSTSYLDLVNQYCFYQGSPYTASPYSSPSVLT